MKGRNKNHFKAFDGDEYSKSPGKEEGKKILADRVDNVMKEKFTVLLDMYMKNAY